MLKIYCQVPLFISLFRGDVLSWITVFHEFIPGMFLLDLVHYVIHYVIGVKYTDLHQDTIDYF